MPITDAIAAVANLAKVGIQAARDPAWSQAGDKIRQGSLDDGAAYARASREWCVALDIDPEKSNGEATAALVTLRTDRLRELLLRELGARGGYMGEHPGVKEPTLALPISVIDAIYAELRGRRRDAELGEIGATAGVIKS